MWPSGPVLVWELSRNRVVVLRQATQPGGIGSLESILRRLKSLKIRARYDNTIPIRFLAPVDCSKIPALGFRPLNSSWSGIILSFFMISGNLPLRIQEKNAMAEVFLARKSLISDIPEIPGWWRGSLISISNGVLNITNVKPAGMHCECVASWSRSFRRTRFS